MAYIRLAFGKEAVERAVEHYVREEVLAGYGRYSKDKEKARKLNVEMVGDEVIVGFDPDEEPAKEGA